MLEADVDEVARTVRRMLRRGGACEMLYHHAVPPLRLVFVPIDPLVKVGSETEKARLVASAIPLADQAASLEDATLVAWLGVGSAILRVAGDAPAPTLMELRLAFPAATISGLRALGDLLVRVCHDPLGEAKAREWIEIQAGRDGE